jgi:hypothetical protein
MNAVAPAIASASATATETLWQPRRPTRAGASATGGTWQSAASTRARGPGATGGLAARMPHTPWSETAGEPGKFIQGMNVPV